MGNYKAALVGKAGEAAVASELMRRHIDVAYPAHDAGVDLIAYLDYSLERFVPIQVKARSSSCYQFRKDWFGIEGIILVQVWNVATRPEFYIFSDLADVEEALGKVHCSTESWQAKGAYTSTSPTMEQIERMQRHRDRWDKIERRLKSEPEQPDRKAPNARWDRFTIQMGGLEVLLPEPKEPDRT